MILNATDLQENSLLTSDDTANVGIKILPNLLDDARLSIFLAKDDVVCQTCVGAPIVMTNSAFDRLRPFGTHDTEVLDTLG